MTAACRITSIPPSPPLAPRPPRHPATPTNSRLSSGQRTVTFAEEQTDKEHGSGGTKIEGDNDREEFLQQDAAAARAQLADAENRARAAEARSAEIARELDEVKRQLREEERRAMGAEGLAADARDEAGSARGIGGAWGGAGDVGDRIEALQRRLEESDAARYVWGDWDTPGARRGTDGRGGRDCPSAYDMYFEEFQGTYCMVIG